MAAERRRSSTGCVPCHTPTTWPPSATSSPSPQVSVFLHADNLRAYFEVHSKVGPQQVPTRSSTALEAAAPRQLQTTNACQNPQTLYQIGISCGYATIENPLSKQVDLAALSDVFTFTTRHSRACINPCNLTPSFISICVSNKTDSRTLSLGCDRRSRAHTACN